MKHIAIIKQSLLLVAGALAVMLTGCIKDDLAECSKLTLKVEGLDANSGQILDITRQGLVTDATLYIFDENNNLLEARDLSADFILAKEEIKLDKYPDHTKLKIVAWGNVKGGNQTVAQPKTLDELKLQLKSTEDGFAQSPDSLYYGAKDNVETLGDGIVVKDESDREIAIRLKTGTYTIKTIGLPNALKAYGLKSASDFDFYIDQTLNTYNNAGKLEGDSIGYNPEGEYDSAQEWLTKGVIDNAALGGKQNSFSGKNLGVAIKSKDESVDKTLYTDDEGNPFEIPEGGRLDVQILFGEDGTISARMRITPWGVVEEDIEF